MYSIDRDGVVTADGSEGKMVSNEKETSTTKKKSIADTVALKQLNLHGKQVVDKMIKEGVPPTPSNYAIYFEKLMENKTLAQKENINTVLKLETIEDFDYVLKIENNINDGFKNIKSMMDVISQVYQKINRLRAITNKRKREIASSSSTKVSLLSLDEDLSEISEALTKQQTLLKKHYNDTVLNIKKFNSDSIFDKKYNVYNKKYLLKIIDHERKNTENFGYESTVLGLKVKDDCLKDVRLTRDKELIIKMVAKMILKRSRRSDIITHFENGIFLIILKHTNIEQSKRTIESIDNMIGLSNYIVDSEAIDIELNYAITSINPNRSREQIISSILDQLQV